MGMVAMQPNFCEAGLCGLRGAIPAMPFSYNPQEDYTLKQQWANTYYQQSVQFAQNVISEMRARGFSVNVGSSADCLPAAGCIGLASYSGTISKNGQEMAVTLGNPVRFNSPSEEADYIASLFDQQAFASQLAQQQAQQQVQQAQQQTASSTSTGSQFTSSSSTTASSSGSNTSSVPLSATITARDGYVVGRSWEVVVTGPPGQPVSVRAFQDDKDLGQTQYGVTAADGKFRMSGTFTSDTVGRWTEHWYVGDKLAGTVNFIVTKAAAAPQPGEMSTKREETRDTGTTAGPGDTDPGIRLENRSSISIPGWMLLAGAGVVALAMFSGGGKK
jgi:hypothetical protein